jgi:hypothetical protein
MIPRQLFRPNQLDEFLLLTKSYPCSIPHHSSGPLWYPSSMSLKEYNAHVSRRLHSAVAPNTGSGKLSRTYALERSNQAAALPSRPFNGGGETPAFGRWTAPPQPFRLCPPEDVPQMTGTRVQLAQNASTLNCCVKSRRGSS